MAKRMSFDDLKGSADFRRMNPALFGDVPPEMVHRPVQTEETYKPKLNKSEEEVLRMLEREHPDALIIPQPTRFFRLEGGGTYTPDFLVFNYAPCPMVVEVKGGYRGPGADQGVERYKRAAAQFCDFFRFEMWRRTGGKWERVEWGK